MPENSNLIKSFDSNLIEKIKDAYQSKKKFDSSNGKCELLNENKYLKIFFLIVSHFKKELNSSRSHLHMEYSLT